MISKERLEELIKENKSVYEIECGEQIAQLNLDSIYCAATDDCLLFYNYATVFCNLFETKKEAELHLEFANVERVEKMPYVSWEELLKEKEQSDYYTIRFAKSRFDLDEQYLFRVNFNSNRIYFKKEIDGMTSRELFEKPLTKENYYEALRLAKKLLLGEEV